MKNSIFRFIAAAALILTTAVFLRARSGNEVFPPRQQLQSFPQVIDGWKSTDLPIDKDTLQMLGPGDFLLRDYTNPDTDAVIDLYIAYFASQRTGDTIHSPKNCLPGAGWSPVEARRTSITPPGRSSFPVNRYVIAKGDSRQLVLYWYWAHDRAVASEYWAKYYLIADSIKMNRSDGSLIRVSTTLYPGESTDDAQRRLLPFVAAIIPQLPTYIPR